MELIAVKKLSACHYKEHIAVLNYKYSQFLSLNSHVVSLGLQILSSASSPHFPIRYYQKVSIKNKTTKTLVWPQMSKAMTIHSVRAGAV